MGGGQSVVCGMYDGCMHVGELVFGDDGEGKYDGNCLYFFYSSYLNTYSPYLIEEKKVYLIEEKKMFLLNIGVKINK